MTRLEKLLKKWSLFSAHFPTRRINIDVGSRWTKLSVNGKYFLHPTAVLYQESTNTVVAVGEKAEQLGITGTGELKIFHPIEDGKITQARAAKDFLTILLEEYLPQNLQSFISPSLIKSVDAHPEQSSQVRAFTQVLQSLSRNIKLVPVSEMLWLAAQRQSTVFQAGGANSVGCVIDCGASTTKFFLYAAGNVVASHKLNEGGDSLTLHIQQLIRQKYHCEVGEAAAEKCKKLFLTFEKKSLPSSPQTYKIHGKDVVTHLPIAVELDKDIFRPVLRSLLQNITGGFSELCQKSQPQFVADLQSSGIFLSGGASQSFGLQKALENELQLQVFQSSFPQRDIVESLAKND